MKPWLILAGLALALAAPAAGEEAAGPARQADGPVAAAVSGESRGQELHPLFAPSEEEVAAAARLGEAARKAGRRVEELLERWAVAVPEAGGKVVLMAPTARAAAAAYEAAKLHKSVGQREAAIEEALRRSKGLVVFEVTLLSKGSGSWLWPEGMKPGDRKALESISFVLSDGRGRHYQPVDPNAERRVEARPKVIGSPIPVTAYGNVGRFWFSLPILRSAARTDFAAKYEVAFPLYEEETGRPIVSADLKSLGLKIIGARGEREVSFPLAELGRAGAKAGK
jgi:hypothetical protein